MKTKCLQNNKYTEDFLQSILNIDIKNGNAPYMINGIQNNTQFLTLTLLWLSDFGYVQFPAG